MTEFVAIVVRGALLPEITKHWPTVSAKLLARDRAELAALLVWMRQAINVTYCCVRNSEGVMPVAERKARVKALWS